MGEKQVGPTTPIPHQIDPDPFFIFIAVLGAIGSFASIISLIESKIEQRAQERERGKKTWRELADLFVELEAEYTELTALLKGLEAILRRRPDDAIPLSRFPFEFGGYKPLYVGESFTTYVETLSAISRKTGHLIELTSNILKRLYTYEVRISPRLLEELVKFRVDLNLMLKGQPNYQDAFQSYYAIISKGDFLIRELKNSLWKRKDYLV